MKQPFKLALLAMCAAVAAAPLAQAQTRGPWGDRDHDGIPNRYDRHNDNGPWGDRDHDGIPNRFDRHNNNRGGAWNDHDRDDVYRR